MPEKHTFEWVDVNFSIEISQPGELCGIRQKKQILQDVSGKVVSGDICAIVGPSGSGKTVLLNILSSCLSTPSSQYPKLSGQLYYDNKLVQSSTFRKLSANVSQDDFLFAFLTVEETLTLAAHFNLPSNLSSSIVSSSVNSIIQQLGLESVRKTLVGSKTQRGISGGERKRVAIGKELLSNPSIILLDEPTSGLDSFQALSLVQTLEDLAQKGRIVLAVIHQPSSAIFKLFNKLLLLTKGKVVYFGTTTRCMDYFSSIGYPFPMENMNPSEYILDLISIDTRSLALKHESDRRIDILMEAWKETSQQYTSLKRRPVDEEDKSANVPGDLIEEESLGFRDSHEEKHDYEIVDNDLVEYTEKGILIVRHQHRKFLLPFINFKNLLWRSCAQLYRNTFSVSVRISSSLFFAAILSLLFQQLQFTQKNIQDRLGLLFFLTTNQSFAPLVSALNTFPEVVYFKNTLLKY
jgi:ABC-type multidrug transport system ATPase subunit